MGETVYKLTNDKSRTRVGCPNETQWEPGVEHTAPGGKLCTPDVIHAYRSAPVAIFMDRHHGCYTARPAFRLWLADADVHVADGTKLGCTRLRTIKQVGIPELTRNHRARAAILCALEVYSESAFASWAKAWLSGQDRSATAALATRETIIVPLVTVDYIAHLTAYAASDATSAAINAAEAVACGRGHFECASAAGAIYAKPTIILADILNQAIKDEAALEAQGAAK